MFGDRIRNWIHNNIEMKCFRNLVILLMTLLSLNAITAMGQVVINDVKPTPFFPKVVKGEALKQLAYIYVEATKDMPVKVQISVGENSYIQDAQLKKGLDTLDVLVPDIQKHT